MSNSNRVKSAVLAAALAAASCAINPAANQRLAEARGAYQVATADPLVQRHAQPELQQAANALAEAERAAKDDSSELVEHNAYIAERSARTAVTVAQARQAQIDLIAVQDERRKRLVEAERARAEQAEKARQEAEARASLLAEEKAKMEAAAAEMKRLESSGLQVRQTERGWVVIANDDLLFESGTTLRPEADRTLDTLAEFLRNHRDRSVAVEGFTDSTGPADAAERRSERRAEAVKFALVQRGVEPSRIDARGMGPNFPIASNDTESGRQRNRRVEVLIR